MTALASGGAVSLALAPLQRCPGCVVGAASLAVASVGRYVRLESRERSGAVWCGFGRRDALGGSWVSLALLACSQPRIAAEGAVRARRGHVCGLVRAG